MLLTASVSSIFWQALRMVAALLVVIAPLGQSLT